MRRTRLMLCVLAGVVYFGSAAAESAPPAAAPAATAPVDGVWTENRYSFTHLGFTSVYSCDGLASKLKVLLRAAGARADIVANPIGCAMGSGRPDRFARVDLRFYTLRPVAAGAPAADAPAPVPGVWKAIRFDDRRPRDLEAGDCELLEEFRNVLLPLFATRAVDDGLRCVPHQVSAGGLGFGFEAFVAAPVPAAS